MGRRIPVIIMLSITLLGIGLCMLECNRSGENRDASGDMVEAEFVGRASCVECHEMENDLFTGSHHDWAMDMATAETVLGDFNESAFTQHGITHRFYQKDSTFFVFTEGPGGEMQEYPITYTFGVEPLQQYLIEFPNGAYQCLPIAWDTRPEEEGGQKWFHVYGDERIPPDDILFWTRPTQNWNYMCAECHSTNLQKNYDHSTRSYNTTWSEIDVSCEACHGPGSLHIDWALKVEEGASPDIYEDLGLVIRLKDRDNAAWIFDPDSVNARRSVPRQTDEVVQMCARCHSRRAVLTEEYFHGGTLLETHWPSLLDEGLYFADGQILEEVYVYGSFLQSKMHQAGVVCKDCHEPHSGNIYVDGNGLCYRCHLATEFAGRNHHFHDPADEGASCVECHMHERTYMQNDPRRDHSMYIPRPDLSDKLGTPNPCNQCHTDKTTQWATNYLAEWYGKELLDTEHHGEVFWAGRQGYPEALPGLKALSAGDHPTMLRANSTSLLVNYPIEQTREAVLGALRDPDPLVRYAGLTITQFMGDQLPTPQLVEMLSDSIKLIRLMAAYSLAGTPQENWSRQAVENMSSAMEEYLASLEINTDHPGTHVNLGNLYLKENRLSEAEAAYKEAISLEPALATAYINLADLYRRLGRDTEGEKLLKTTLQQYPDLAPINYSLGLLKVRQQQAEEGLNYIRIAAEQEPGQAQYSYTYAIALNSLGKPEEAVDVLKSANEMHPYNQDILYALTTIHLELGETETATNYLERFMEYYPNHPNIAQLQQYLNSL